MPITSHPSSFGSHWTGAGGSAVRNSDLSGRWFTSPFTAWFTTVYYQAYHYMNDYTDDSRATKLTVWLITWAQVIYPFSLLVLTLLSFSQIDEHRSHYFRYGANLIILCFNFI